MLQGFNRHAKYWDFEHIYIYVACDQSTLQIPLINSKLKATFILSTDNKPGTIYFNMESMAGSLSSRLILV